MNSAIIKDINKQYIKAVVGYENEIAKNKLPDIDIFINLAFLYWSFAAQQIEFNIPNNISDEWSLIGGEKFMSTIDKGLTIYPSNVELHFWKQYFNHRLFMIDFSQSDCKALLEKYDNHTSLVPYFFLYLFDKETYKNQIDRLLKECTHNPTAKNNYIRTFIE
jgi:hypothetical protein